MDNSRADKLTWHSQALDSLSRCFAQDPRVLAFVLVGSLANADADIDVWSDIDAKLILADAEASAAADHYFYFTDWLAPFGQRVGIERHESSATKTLRVCLEGFQRFDLVFITASALRQPSLWQENPFYPSHRVLWSRLPDLESQMAALPHPGAYQAIARDELEHMVDAFWYKASAAIVKVARNDLLIGQHLALDLARDCLVLQMLRRDQVEQTKIHRTGGWGNELVARLYYGQQADTVEAVLDLIRVSCDVFDSLAQEILPAYSPRSSLLEEARKWAAISQKG